jgi:hypothetical protein
MAASVSKDQTGLFQLKHGHFVGGKPTSEWRAWDSMLARCYCAGHTNFARYGGKGVAVCERWRHDFATFLSDMGPKPSPQHTLDRIDGTLGYEPSNCRWATRKEQQNNIRTNRRITWNGRTLTLQQWSDETTLPPSAISRRLKRGWPVERALTEPVMHGVHLDLASQRVVGVVRGRGGVSSTPSAPPVRTILPCRARERNVNTGTVTAPSPRSAARPSAPAAVSAGRALAWPCRP